MDATGKIGGWLGTTVTESLESLQHSAAQHFLGVLLLQLLHPMTTDPIFGASPIINRKRGTVPCRSNPPFSVATLRCSRENSEPHPPAPRAEEGMNGG